MAIWGLSMSSTLGFFWWLRRFNLVEHERKDWGFGGMGLLLMCLPVYVKAGVQALMRRPLVYAVTAKGDLASPDNVRTFAPHLKWAAVVASGLGISLSGLGSTFVGVQFWLAWSLLVCLSAPAVWLASTFRPELPARAVVDQPVTRLTDRVRLRPRKAAQPVEVAAGG